MLDKTDARRLVRIVSATNESATKLESLYREQKRTAKEIESHEAAIAANENSLKELLGVDVSSGNFNYVVHLLKALQAANEEEMAAFRHTSTLLSADHREA